MDRSADGDTPLRLGRHQISRGLFATLTLIASIGLVGPEEASAQQQAVHVLLAPEAVSAQALVEQFDFSSGSEPPLASLTAVPVTSVEYLLPNRATGAFATYLAAHPDTPRARLERYVVITYNAANVGNAITALRGDSAIENAYVPAQPEFAVAPGLPVRRALAALATAQVSTDWSIPLHVPEAWDVASGWSLVGSVNSGIATSHPALRSFVGSKYAGGNFLPALSFDIGRTGLPGCFTVGDCIEPNVDEAQPVPMAAGGTCDSDGDGMGTPSFAGHGTPMPREFAR